MNLSFAIGTTSSNEEYILDIKNLPHLFISYCYGHHIEEFFKEIYKSLKDTNRLFDVSFVMALTKAKSSLGYSNRLRVADTFNLYEAGAQNLSCKDNFWNFISREINNRKKVGKRVKHADSIFQDFPLLIIYMDDVFDFIISSKKTIGIKFLQLLLLGPQLGIHLIAASSSAYRNLIKQLLAVNPLIMKKFQLHSINHLFPLSSALGAELIRTSEDFVFFKDAHANDYCRLYPLQEHQVLKEASLV